VRTHFLIIGGTRQQRIAAARARGARQPVIGDAATLPFVRPAPALLDAAPRVISIDDVERAFPNTQSGVRLVLTQSTYLVQKWIDTLRAGDRLVVTAERTALDQAAPEAFQARGPWAAFELVDLDRATTILTTGETKDTENEERNDPTRHSEKRSDLPFVSFVVDERPTALVVRAYGSPSTAQRIALCREAVAIGTDDPVAQLALASACREARDVRGARAALDRALAIAPAWEAVHFEDGKFWLDSDDMEQACAAFQRACDLMPSFSASFSNLGATLGELDQPDAALAAFRQALAHDPQGFPILNNIGVVSRELGRLDESEAAFRRVIALAPSFVFGYYNLGHTLFLAGKIAAALAAYEEGQRRDPEKNRRQACRLAVMRFANGDLAGAERDLWAAADAAPTGERADLLLEAYEIAHAAVAQNPRLDADRRFVGRIGEAIAHDGESHR
jgi:tetratricopeptide (TPR) repeat protein